MAEKKKRTRRTAEQMIADLEAKIASVKRRAEQKKARKDPALRHVSGAVKSIDKALGASEDAATRTALAEARTALAAILSLNGVELRGNGGARRGGSGGGGARVTPEQVAGFLADHPGSSAESVAAGLGTDIAGIRPALTRLKAWGEVKAKGRGRATRYRANQ